MSKFILSLSFIFFTLFVSGQYSVSGQINDEKGEPIVGAVISIESQHQISDALGKFILTNVPKGRVVISIEHLSYQDTSIIFQIYTNSNITIPLLLNTNNLEAIEVLSTWASKKTPVTFLNVNRKEIDKRNLGQDVPYLLKWTPSVTVSSDAGTGIGYTGLRIRGSDPTRINVTINGIPVNDSESQGVFWVDLPDLLSSTSDIQIQRGLGTSGNGAGAFGASINLRTNSYSEQPRLILSSTVGSFNTFKKSVSLNTGLINDKFYGDIRLSSVNSDGYIERATADLDSYFASFGYIGQSTSLKFYSFSGHEKTYQAWNGVPVQYLEDADLRKYNSAGTERTDKPHPEEVDDYRQSHYQLIFDHFKDDFKANLSLHYTKGEGFFEQYKSGQTLRDYGIEPLQVGGTTFEQTNLIRRRWLDNDFFGAVFSATKMYSNVELVFGGGWNRYDGRHFGEIIWAGVAPNLENDFLYYDNDAIKRDWNFYTKTTWFWNLKWSTYLDLQIRNIKYDFLGYNHELINVNQSISATFFNPKLGIHFQPNQYSEFYLALGMGNKEPNRDDYVESSPITRPDSEKMISTELGSSFQLGSTQLQGNIYIMYYKDQLINTGRINDVGEYGRQNVDKSYRLGFEGSIMNQLSENWRFLANFTVSKNQVLKFNEYVDNWDNGMQQVINHQKTPLALSPRLITSAGIQYSRKIGNKKIQAEILTKYVGKQYIDNTGNEKGKISAYNYSDFVTSYSFPLWGSSAELKASIRNILNSKYSSSAWTYRFISNNYDPTPDDPYSISEGNGYYNLTGHYPQAGTNLLLGVVLTF